MKVNISRIFIALFCLVTTVLFCVALFNYPGSAIYYIIFSLTLNALLIAGFTKKKIFFDTFIGIFFWLGYWLKFSVRVGLMSGEFYADELIGNFSGTSAGYDHALLITSCGVSALLIASFLRRLLFSYTNVNEQLRHEYVFEYYQKYRTSVLTLFFLLFTAIAISNVELGIYQRGSVPKTILPFGFSGVYAWFLMFGLASVSAVILDCEFRITKNPYLASIVALLECFFSNVSMLSRGMVLNGGSLIIGIVDNAKKRLIKMTVRYSLIVFVAFLIFFLSSVFSVNYMRDNLFYTDFPTNVSASKSYVFKSFLHSNEIVMNALMGFESLLIDRWVGIEGVMAVSSYPKLGWDLWKEAWGEKTFYTGTSMYDIKILGAPALDAPKHHFISLPGILAFFYYPGSFLFLFVCMLLLGLLAAGIEVFVYKCGGANLILCSLIAQVVAYRYAHFGYVPSQSHLLFGSIFLNIMIIYFFNKLLFLKNKN